MMLRRGPGFGLPEIAPDEAQLSHPVDRIVLRQILTAGECAVESFAIAALPVTDFEGQIAQTKANGHGDVDAHGMWATAVPQQTRESVSEVHRGHSTRAGDGRRLCPSALVPQQRVR